jgi:chondroitin 4-sulfotransferase 11
MLKMLSTSRWISYRLRERYIHRFVFIHINKTGGSSIEHILGLPLDHRTAREKLAVLGRRHWDSRFTFAFVRNPWGKVFSHYAYRVKTGQTGMGENAPEFPEWVKRAYGDRDPHYYDLPKMFMPQCEWIDDEHGNQLVDFVGRFERLHEDWDAAAPRIGFKLSLPHLNASGSGGYRDRYDAESASIVRKWFRSDIERFGYEF